MTHNMISSMHVKPYRTTHHHSYERLEATGACRSRSSSLSAERPPAAQRYAEGDQHARQRSCTPDFSSAIHSTRPRST